jgi:hypothetical protein
MRAMGRDNEVSSNQQVYGSKRSATRGYKAFDSQTTPLKMDVIRKKVEISQQSQAHDDLV